MKVAALQMVSGSALAANLGRARALLESAVAAGAELAVLPEYFCALGHTDSDKLAIAEVPGDGPVQSFLAGAARELGLWIVGGTLPLRIARPQPEALPPDGAGVARVCNSSLAFAPDGAQVARYDKIHLFVFDNGRERYDERRLIAPGPAAPVLFELPSRDGHRWRIGMSVCYDLRFPELYRALAQRGADLLLVPSAFTHTTGRAHWEVLLRARAIENLAWVVAPAQGGRHDNGRQTWGHSLIADPWGALVAQQAEGEGVVLAELDARHIERCRRQLPALAHRAL